MPRDMNLPIITLTKSHKLLSNHLKSPSLATWVFICLLHDQNRSRFLRFKEDEIEVFAY